jgi:phospho-N-acetylmuramoyl-pentapeptide-transferase
MEIWYLMLLTFILTFLILNWLINYQKRNRVGQIEREEGLRSHKEKNKTPIFGGVAFVLSYLIVFTFLLIINEINIYIYLLIVMPMTSFSLLGFIDDYLILKYKKNEGIKPNIKFLIQIIISVLFFIIYLILNFDTKINLFFITIDLKFLYGIFILLAFSGFTNATNLTDGVDGLLAGTFSFILIGLFLITNNSDIRNLISIIFSGICAFLYFNLPKAKIFMGDTGSLAIGSLFVSLAIILKLEVFLFIFGLVYVLETLSVMLQVAYFKYSKGKRIFKMSPLHHHFEIVFNSEIKTLILFYLFTIMTVIFGVLLFINYMR